MKEDQSAGWLLVVEDQPDLWRILELYLKRLLPHVPTIHALNAPAALTQLEQTVAAGKPLPRLVLTNLYMPKLEDGLNFLTSLQEPGSAYQTVPIIVISSSVNAGDKQQVHQRGATYFTKPISSEQWFTFFKSIQTYWPSPGIPADE
ncbi:response regulator [Fibrella arboris]|uniref:response regulator n=1 Tax=Fibrella arboris TaxID=3242486 RepID=UPI003520128A